MLLFFHKWTRKEQLLLNVLYCVLLLGILTVVEANPLRHLSRNSIFGQQQQRIRRQPEEEAATARLTPSFIPLGADIPLQENEVEKVVAQTYNIIPPRLAPGPPQRQAAVPLPEIIVGEPFIVATTFSPLKPTTDEPFSLADQVVVEPHHRMPSHSPSYPIKIFGQPPQPSPLPPPAPVESIPPPPPPPAPVPHQEQVAVEPTAPPSVAHHDEMNHHDNSNEVTHESEPVVENHPSFSFFEPQHHHHHTTSPPLADEATEAPSIAISFFQQHHPTAAAEITEAPVVISAPSSIAHDHAAPGEVSIAHEEETAPEEVADEAVEHHPPPPPTTTSIHHQETVAHLPEPIHQIPVVHELPTVGPPPPAAVEQPPQKQQQHSIPIQDDIIVPAQSPPPAPPGSNSVYSVAPPPPSYGSHGSSFSVQPADSYPRGLSASFRDNSNNFNSNHHAITITHPSPTKLGFPPITSMADNWRNDFDWHRMTARSIRF